MKIFCEPISNNNIFKYCHHKWSSVDLITDEDRDHTCREYLGHDWIHICTCGSIDVVTPDD